MSKLDKFVHLYNNVPIIRWVMMPFVIVVNLVLYSFGVLKLDAGSKLTEKDLERYKKAIDRCNVYET